MLVFFYANYLIMKTYKQLLNEWAMQTDCLHKMTDEEMKQLKFALLGMYKDIDSICRKNGLTVMLGGGSCLGAIRHNGFIPWDDDLDLNMPRRDYDKFIELCESGALGTSYEFAYPDGIHSCSSAFLKVYKKNTIMEGLGMSNKGDSPRGIFIDIFPIEGVPSNIIIRKIKGLIADAMRFIGNCVLGVERSSDVFERSVNECPELKRMIRKRRAVGFFFSFIPYKKWAYCYDSFVKNSDMESLVGIPTGRCRYNGEIHNYNVFLPTSKAMFEGLEVNVPGKTDIYLSRLYGKNYMQLPPEEKRERHFISNFKL